MHRKDIVEVAVAGQRGRRGERARTFSARTRKNILSLVRLGPRDVYDLLTWRLDITYCTTV